MMEPPIRYRANHPGPGDVSRGPFLWATIHPGQRDMRGEAERLAAAMEMAERQRPAGRPEPRNES